MIIVGIICLVTAMFNAIAGFSALRYGAIEAARMKFGGAVMLGILGVILICRGNRKNKRATNATEGKHSKRT